MGAPYRAVKSSAGPPALDLVTRPLVSGEPAVALQGWWWWWWCVCVGCGVGGGGRVGCAFGGGGGLKAARGAIAMAGRTRAQAVGRPLHRPPCMHACCSPFFQEAQQQAHGMPLASAGTPAGSIQEAGSEALTTVPATTGGTELTGFQLRGRKEGGAGRRHVSVRAASVEHAAVLAVPAGCALQQARAGVGRCAAPPRRQAGRQAEAVPGRRSRDSLAALEEHRGASGGEHGVAAVGAVVGHQAGALAQCKRRRGVGWGGRLCVERGMRYGTHGPCAGPRALCEGGSSSRHAPPPGVWSPTLTTVVSAAPLRPGSVQSAVASVGHQDLPVNTTQARGVGRAEGGAVHAVGFAQQASRTSRQPRVALEGAHQ